jgi:hypothetical protein
VKRLLTFILLIIFALPTFSQSTIDPLDWYKGVSKDSIKRYKIYSYVSDSSYVDTNLTTKKYIKLNLLRKDNINLVSFANQGENYNWLTYQEGASLVPEMGFRTKHFNYLNQKDIKYYDVATPMTELAYRTGYNKGQFLDAIFSMNINPHLNFSIGYKGLRSVGKYHSSLTSQGNFQTAIHYISKDKKYYLRTHFTFQDLYNQESGGIENDTLFTSNNSDFTTRTAFAMNLTDASTMLKGKRFFIDHRYNLPINIGKSNLFIEHTGSYETKYFQYTDKVANNLYFFGSEVFDSKITNDSTKYRNIQNDAYLGIKGNDGKSYLKFGIGYNNQKYGYDTIKVITDNKLIPASIEGNTASIKAEGRIYILNNLSVNARGSYNIDGKFSDAFDLMSSAKLNINNKHTVGASIGLYSYYPEMQFWLYQSNYKSYNYFNRLDKQYKVDFKLYFESNKWFDAHIRYINHKKYTFFDSGDIDVYVPDGKSIPYNNVTPVKTVQYGGDVNIVEIGLHKDFKFGLFGFDTNTIFQKVLSGEEVFRVPEIVTRNNIYYKDDWFRHAMVVQTGFGVKYFTEFSSFQYNPLNGMYFRPKQDLKIGNFPIFNFFFNARIRTFRVFVELENFTQPIFNNYNYFSAPHYPGSDFAVRFGFVWNFFS